MRGEFFLRDQRQNLPKAPACQVCSSSKSQLEHYLTEILLFGARTPAAAEIARQALPKRIATNRWLRDAVAQAGPRPGNVAIAIHAGPLEQLCALIARGLLWHYWRVVPPGSYAATAVVFEDAGRAEFAKTFAVFPAARRVAGSLAGRVQIRWAFGRDPCFSLWALGFYGGAQFAESNRRAGSLIVAATGRTSFIGGLRGSKPGLPNPSQGPFGLRCW